MKKIILTVQSTKSGWRLGLNKTDSISYFKHGEDVKFILPNFDEFCVKTACGTSSKKAFDFNGKKINEWIKINNFDDYKPRKPTKLEFELSENLSYKILTFLMKKTSP